MVSFEMHIEVARCRILYIVSCCAWHVLQMQAEIADAIAKNCRPWLYKEVLSIALLPKNLVAVGG
jgi:hypothetical protein